MAAQNTKVYRKQGGAEMVVASGGTLRIESGGTLAVDAGGAVTGRPVRETVRSESFDLDNGAGTTVDRVLMRPSTAITITAARIIYDDATSGTVAAGSAKVGTTVGGGEIVAATNYENTKAVGTVTTMTIVSGAVAADTPVIVRHTGVGATQAGRAVVELEFTVNA